MNIYIYITYSISFSLLFSRAQVQVIFSKRQNTFHFPLTLKFPFQGTADNAAGQGVILVINLLLMATKFLHREYLVCTN